VNRIAYLHLISRGGKNEFTLCPSRNLPRQANLLTGILQYQRFSHKFPIDIKSSLDSTGVIRNTDNVVICFLIVSRNICITLRTV
jgi:hypothetical protein